MPVSVVILTRNEEANILACLESCAWCDDVHVLDSNSMDRTREIAGAWGANVHIHSFQSFGQQRNWAIDHIPARHDWIFHLDADERFTPELVNELTATITRNPAEAGFFVANKLMFMGRWLKHASGYPVYQMRFFHKARMRFTDYGHGQRELASGTIGRLREPYLHFNFSKGVADWVQRHNRYSTLEANELFAEPALRSISLSSRESVRSADTVKVRGPEAGSQVVKTGSESVCGSDPTARRRFLKSRIYPRLPAKWLWRFGYTYFLKLGILDGRPGLQYSLLISYYDFLIDLKLAEQKRTGKMAKVQMDEPITGNFSASSDEGIAGSIAAQRNTSPWTRNQKLGRLLWMIVSAILFRPSFHNWYAWRRMLLRVFGAKIGLDVRIRPTVRIEIPWNLDIGDYAAVGDHAILYSLGRITLGRMASVSQYAHLCAGTHDYMAPAFPLVCLPITIGDEAWIATDAFVGPGVNVGSRAIVAARATVVKDVAAGQIVAGNPARFIKLRDDAAKPSTEEATPTMPPAVGLGSAG